MFDKPFDYIKFNTQKRRNAALDVFYIEHNYNFRGKNSDRYLAIAEQYENSIYAIKFCHHLRKNYSDRFNLLTKLNECSRVLATIGKIMRELYKEDPYASFIFIGSPLPGESHNNTKRFCLYSKIVINVISPVRFFHYTSPSQSSYIAINRDNAGKIDVAYIEEVVNFVLS